MLPTISSTPQSTQTSSSSAQIEFPLLADLQIIDLSVDGGSVARLNNQVVFLDRGLPGSTVHAEIIAQKKQVLIGKFISYKKISPFQVEKKCDAFPQCGGCSWQDLLIDEQISWKRKHALETLKRIGKISLEKEDAFITSSPFHMRNKMAFVFSKNNSQVQIGQYSRSSNELEKITNCYLQKPASNAVLHYLIEYFASKDFSIFNGKTGFLRHLLLRCPDQLIEEKPQVHVEIITSPVHTDEDKGYAKELKELAKNLLERTDLHVHGFVHGIRKDLSKVAKTQKVYFQLGSAYYQESFHHLHLSVGYDTFLQTNTAVAEKMYALIKEEAQGYDTVWDLYGGCGSIALYIAPFVKKVYGVEIEKSSTKIAKYNAHQLKQTNCHFSSQAVNTSLLQNIADAPDCVIVDPPRAGLEQEAIALLKKVKAKKLIYISCHTGTQARDVLLLSKHWKVEKVFLADMFPHTPHIESILVLSAQ